MKIKCLHGFFIFEEQSAGELADFVALTGLQLVRKGELFTFEQLVDAPKYSIKGAPLLNTTAVETSEGQPWDVFRSNAMIYNFDSGLVVPIASITVTANLSIAGNIFLSSGLIIPGSVMADGSRVTDYAAWFSTDSMRFRYSEVTSV